MISLSNIFRNMIEIVFQVRWEERWTVAWCWRIIMMNSLRVIILPTTKHPSHRTTTQTWLTWTEPTTPLSSTISISDLATSERQASSLLSDHWQILCLELRLPDHDHRVLHLHPGRGPVDDRSADSDGLRLFLLQRGELDTRRGGAGQWSAGEGNFIVKSGQHKFDI